VNELGCSLEWQELVRTPRQFLKIDLLADPHLARVDLHDLGARVLVPSSNRVFVLGAEVSCERTDASIGMAGGLCRGGYDYLGEAFPQRNHTRLDTDRLPFQLTRQFAHKKLQRRAQKLCLSGILEVQSKKKNDHFYFA
jgi:hypothetical protein